MFVGKFHSDSWIIQSRPNGGLDKAVSNLHWDLLISLESHYAKSFL